MKAQKDIRIGDSVMFTKAGLHYENKYNFKNERSAKYHETGIVTKFKKNIIYV